MGLFLLILEFLLFVLLFFLLIFALLFLFFYGSLFYSDILGAPFVPLNKKYLSQILEISDLDKNDIFFDFGCGDGRVLITAVKNFGVKKAVGFEASPAIYWLAKFFITIKGLNSKIKVFRKNFLKIKQEDFEEASVIFLYLFPKIVENLFSSQLLQLKPGKKIICVSFFPQLENQEFRLLKSEKVGWHSIRLYQKV